jgi:hypothetical protein
MASLQGSSLALNKPPQGLPLIEARFLLVSSRLYVRTLFVPSFDFRIKLLDFLAFNTYQVRRPTLCTGYKR